MAEENIPQTPIESNSQEVETKETPIPTTNRDKFFANIIAKHPEYENDEEGVFGYAIEKYGKQKSEIGKRDELETNMINILNNDGSTLDFLDAMAQLGVIDALTTLPEDTLEEALRRIKNGYSLADEEKENKRREMTDRNVKKRAFEQKIKDNEPKTRQALEEFATENELSEEEVEGLVLPIIQKLSEGAIDKDLLNMIKNNRSLDDIKKKEYERGLADGRNGKITEKTLKKEKGSGLPQPSNTKQTEEEEEDKNNPFAFITRKR